MHSTRLLTVTAIIEAGAGICFVGLPGLATWLLLAVREPSSEAIVIARLGGAALFSIGVVCWLARADRASRAQHGLLSGMFVYNAAACAVLAYAGGIMSMAGVILWPGVVLHAAMATWCGLKIRQSSGWAQPSVS